MRKRMDQAMAPSGDAETVIGKSTRLHGEITGEGNIRIDGTVEGTISIEGNAVIGESGNVEGDIKAANLVVSGTVTGNANIEGNLCIQATGQLVGDVKVKSFNIEDGGIFMGRSEMSLRGLNIPAMESIRPSARKAAEAQATPATAIIPEPDSYVEPTLAPPAPPIVPPTQNAPRPRQTKGR
ncbi:MAG: polymer-forming cytoskeletal protein [Selenomonadaceae bacterium]|nr:polymer-forming cytoskeletal protein [Selenomonadaceae bacterium]